MQTMNVIQAKRPKVSVVIPVFNGKRFLRQAVLSVLQDPLKSKEIIVVDDGSTDRGIKSIEDLPVRILRLKENFGQPSAQNRGLDLIRGDTFTFLDSDDILFCGSIKWRYDWLRKNPVEVAVAGRPAGLINERGESLSQFPHLLHPQFVPPKRLSLDFFRKGGAFPVEAWNFLFRRSCLTLTNGFDESLTTGEDVDFLFRILSSKTIPVVFKPVSYRRIHSNQLSLSYNKGRLKLKQKTINACKKVCKKYGVYPTQWKPWATGYQH